MPASSKTRPPLRRWPALVILAGAAAFLAWLWIPPDSPVTMSQPTVTLIALVVTGLLLLLWWLLLSRARWWARLGVLAVVVGLGWTTSRLLEVRGVTGDLLPRLAFGAAPTPVPLPSPAAPEAPEPAAVPSPKAEPTARPPEAEGAAAPSPPASLPIAPAVAATEPERPAFPQFLGPHRDATLEGVHLARGWERRPPVALWRQPIGAGWSGFAVAEGRAVTQEQRDGREMVVAYDLETGRVLWSRPGGPGYESTMTGDGPRATPTLAGGRVYAFGVSGLLQALDLATGRVIFERNVLDDNGARPPMHGIASSPLLVDDVVVVLAGGPGGRSLVAYDASTGERRWSGGDDPAAYSSPLVATLGGVRQIVVLNRQHLTGHDARTGEVLWRDRWPDRPEKVAQPVILDGDRIFASMGYGIGGRLVQIARDPDGRFRAEVLWQTRRLKSKFAQVVHHDGFLYGLDEGVLVCLDPADGERRWKDGRYGHGQILLVDDLLLVQAENGELALVKPDPERRIELTRFPAVSGKAWATPALAGDLLLVRSDVEAACYRLPTETGA